MKELFQPLSETTPFTFHCGPEVTCFNACCRNLNQFLYPYDVVRLARALGLTCEQFLQRYTHRHAGPETGLPVVSLTPRSEPQKRCPLVTPEGCRVYQDRPASCRLYPLARAVARDPITGGRQVHYALIGEAHCQGHGGGKKWDAQTWMHNQGLAPYNRNNDPMMTVIRFKRRHHPRPLPPSVADAVYRTLYIKVGDGNGGAPVDDAAVSVENKYPVAPDAAIAAAYAKVIQILKESSP